VYQNVDDEGSSSGAVGSAVVDVTSDADVYVQKSETSPPMGPPLGQEPEEEDLYAAPTLASNH
jgi:hypothetical protein